MPGGVARKSSDPAARVSLLSSPASVNVILRVYPVIRCKLGLLCIKSNSENFE